jgi:hypothetical protein
MPNSVHFFLPPHDRSPSRCSQPKACRYRTGFELGGDQAVRLYLRDGSVRWEQSAINGAWSVNASGDAPVS